MSSRVIHHDTLSIAETMDPVNIKPYFEGDTNKIYTTLQQMEYNKNKNKNKIKMRECNTNKNGTHKKIIKREINPNRSEVSEQEQVLYWLWYDKALSDKQYELAEQIKNKCDGFDENNYVFGDSGLDSSFEPQSSIEKEVKSSSKKDYKEPDLKDFIMFKKTIENYTDDITIVNTIRNMITNEMKLYESNELHKLFITTCEKYRIRLDCQVVRIGKVGRRINKVDRKVESLEVKPKTSKEFLKNSRLDVQKLVTYSRTIAPGPRHRLLKQICGEVKDWKRTFDTNSLSDYKAMCELFKKNKLTNSEANAQLVDKKNYKSRFISKFEPQMFEDIRSKIDTISETMGSINGVIKEDLPTLLKTCENVNYFSSTFQNFIEKVSSMYADTSLALKVCGMLNKIYLFGAVIYRKSSMDIVLSALYNMVDGLVPPTCVSYLTEKIRRGLNLASQGVLYTDDFEAQQGEDFREKKYIENENGFIGAIFCAISQTIFGLMGSMTKDEFMNYSINVKKVSTLASLLRACKNLYDYVITLVEFILRYCIKHVTKRISFMPSYFVPEKLTDLFEDLEYIEKNDIVTKSMISSGSARHIMRFREKLNLFLTTSKDNDVNKLIMVHLNYIKRECELWVKNIPAYLKDIPGSDRTRPVWVYIYGKPRIGKTSIISKALVYACAKKMRLIDGIEKWDSFVFNRNLGEPYWEGYNGQPVVSYTDILQEIKDDQKLDLAITELTRINDSNAYSLPMAFEGPKGKGKNFFTSKLIVSDAQDNMNVPAFSERCWSGGQHIYARRAVVLEVVLNPEYAAASGGINYQKFAHEYESGNYIFTKEHPVAPKDAYIFWIRHNTQHNEIVKQFNDFNQAIDYISSFCANTYNKENDQSDGVTNFCEYMFKSETPDVNTVAVFQPQMLNDSNMTFDDDNDSMYFEARACSCYDREEVDIILDMYNYPKDHTMCFSQESDIHSAFKSKQKKSGISKLAKFLKLFTDEIKNYTNRIVELKDTAADRLKDFVDKHPIYAALVTLSTFLGVFLLYKKMSKEGEKSPIIEERTYDADYDRLGHSNRPKRITRTLTSYPQTGEHRERTVKVRRTRQNNDNRHHEDDKVQSQMYTQLNTDTINSTKNSMCRIVISTKRDGKDTVVGSDSALNIGGDVFVMPLHYWTRIKDYADAVEELKIKLYWPSRAKDKFTSIDLKCAYEYPVDKSWKHADDLIYIQFKGLVCGRNLKNKFVSLNDNPDLGACKLVGIRSTSHMCNQPDRDKCQYVYNGDKFKIEMLDVEDTSLVSDTEGLTPDTVQKGGLKYETNPVTLHNYNTYIPGREIVISDYYLYFGVATIAGDCGMLLMHEDVSVQGKFLGMHVAGSPRKAMGAACPIFKEDIEDVLAYFGTVVKLEDTQFVIAEQPITGFGAQAGELDLFVEGRTSTYVKEGKVQQYRVMMPNRTKIRKSLVFDLMEEDFGPHKFAPAKLSKETINGVEHSPMINGLNKLTQYSSMIPEHMLIMISEHVVQSILSWHSRWLIGDKYVLSIQEALNGVDGIKPIDMTTSAGFPFIKMANTCNKVPWIKIIDKGNMEREFEPGPVLVSMCERRIEAAKRGEIIPTYFIDTLKDEVRPLKKVEEFKTRVFQVGPFDLTVVLRQYFGLFIAHCQNTPLNGEMAIGINPDSSDWTFLFDKLMRGGENILCGDYKMYDSSIMHQIALIVIAAANAFYNDSAEHQKIREVLILTIFNSDHLVDNLWYVFKQGNPSGVALTSIINCIANMVFVRYVYLMTVDNDLWRFHNRLQCTFYGDDNTVVGGEAIKGKMTMITMARVLKEIGVEYTSADKTDIVRDYVPLNEMTFLKRHFKRDKHGIVLAPLDIDVVMEIARWSQGDPFNISDQMNRFNDTLRFAMAHGKPKFNEIRKKFVQYCNLMKQGQFYEGDKRLFFSADANLLVTYERVQELMYPEYYKPFPDLASALGEAHEVLQEMGLDT